MKRVAVVGIGNSKFGVRDDASMKELAFEAVKEALADCGLETKDLARHSKRCPSCFVMGE